MLKHLLLTAFLAGAAVKASGQGTVFFSTRAVGARVTTFGGVALGTNNTGGLYYAQLFATGMGQSESTLIPVGNPVNFRTGGNSGYVQEAGTPVGAAVNVPVNTTVTVTTVSGGAVTLQMRLWSSTYATYDDAFASISGGSPGIFGKSTMFSLTETGNANAAPPTLPVDLIGLSSFTTPIIPEPTTYAVAGLAAGIMWMLRRRRA